MGSATVAELNPHSVETRSGWFVDLTDPDPADISLIDIAHNLSHICRFGGACNRFYSVAEHAVLVSRLLGSDPVRGLVGLHHDDAEAYLGDIPRPLKSLLGDEYAALTVRFDLAIRKALDLPDPFLLDLERLVKEADDWALAVEAAALLPSRGRGWTDPPPPIHSVVALGLEPAVARDKFLQRHEELVQQIRSEASRG